MTVLGKVLLWIRSHTNACPHGWNARQLVRGPLESLRLRGLMAVCGACGMPLSRFLRMQEAMARRAVLRVGRNVIGQAC